MRKHRFLLLAAALGVAAALPPAAGARITDLPEVNPHPVPFANLPAAPSPSAPSHAIQNPFAPVTGTSWAGIFDFTVSPPDTNGAIGPSNYLEIINLQLGIYNRSGTLISQTPLGTLTGHSQFNLSDPMVLWDANTQRFYYNVWDTSNATMAWGFSKTTSPATAADFCSYTSSFGYTSSDVPDYPKFGQSKGFLFIGVNHYAGFSAPSSDRSDLLWITKPQGSGSITTCPSASSFTSGRFSNLRNGDGSQAFTPVPAIEDDAVDNGYVVASNDIECPPKCGSGNVITLYVMRPSASNPHVPVIYAQHSITVPTYTSPPGGAPQQGTTNLLDTLDGRLEHAVAAIDPAFGKTMIVWTGHAVAGGAGTQFRWYGINTLPLTSPSVVRSGTVSSPSLWVFNGAIAPDRVVTPSGSAFGNNVVVGFSTSSSSTLPADQMVSQRGTSPQSSFVLVHQSASADNDFTCSPTCRWGDYGGATSDPAQPLTGSTGQVWLTNEAVTSGNNTTWNWEATP